jgi:alkanesulfonate monooxygenase SsuD/methylene tetrahydromethanopterin reductase-like flavin-dependent oxidoreductase (luciferase family)
VLPSVSWSRDEYRALGVPFARRGEILDEQLEVWRRAYAGSPVSFHGRHFSFDDVYLEPAAHRPTGPTLWFGGQTLHRRLLDRLVRHGQGWNPLGAPAPEEVRALHAALRAAGRDPAELELVGGTRAVFPDATSVADLDRAMDAIPEQLAQGFTTFCLKPSQFTDDPDGVAALCQRVVRRAEAFAA